MSTSASDSAPPGMPSEGSNFFESLWLSIFTPGPTPPLLLATNVTFAFLQLLLLVLLVATRSIHFIVLSALSAGLWASINWFSGEVMAAAAAIKESEKEKEKEKEKVGTDADDEADDGGGDTETEAEAPVFTTGAAKSRGGALRVEDAVDVRQRTAAAAKKRLSDSTGELSTDSEWEKVDEEASR